MSISGNMVGMYSTIGKTLVIVDDNGNEITGVITENVQVFDAKPGEDIRAGKVAATDEGIVVGSAVIPNYNTNSGIRLIPNGSSFSLPLQKNYNYTKFQAIICNFNTSLTDSVGSEYVVIEDKLIAVQSTETLSSIIKNEENESVDFGFTNTSGSPCVIRYFTYKELY